MPIPMGYARKKRLIDHSTSRVALTQPTFQFAREAACPTMDKEWADRTARYVKAQIKRRAMTYDELAEKMKPLVFEGRPRPASPTSWREGRSQHGSGCRPWQRWKRRRLRSRMS